jgi:hypothetical protein
MPVTIVSTGGQVVEVTGTGTLTTNVWAMARIRWVSATAAAADTCVVTDTAGNIIFESQATGADWSDEVEMSKVPPTLGIVILTLTSGHLYFYLR